jgi:hypothetical protein
VALSNSTNTPATSFGWLVRNADARANTKKQNLIERYGVDIRLPDLREEIAQCSRQGKMHDGCMVRYTDLILSSAGGRLSS